jgi:flagellar hook-associated protein 2
MRFTGLSGSGFDTDQIVSELMRAERVPLDRLYQKRQLAEWRRDAYRDVTNLLRGFKDQFFNALKPASNMMSASLYRKFSAQSSNAAVSATANADAFTGTYNIVVTQIATASEITSSAEVSKAGDKIKVSDTLETLGSKLETELNFDADGKVSFKINNIDFTFAKTDTLSTVLQRISASNAGVTARYDELTDKVRIISKQTGADVDINVEDVTGNFASAFKLSDLSSKIQGKNAIFSIDGSSQERSTNTFTINGITYNLRAATDLAGATVTVSQDIDGVFESIKTFVDKYNEIIKALNEKLSEKYDRNYPPLTDEQKSHMKEEDIKKWEERARTGLLRNDSMLQNIVLRMRTAMYENIKDVSASLSSIGIKTGNYLEKGKLVIDEAKLKEAIANNPDAVMQVFSKKSEITSNINITSEQRKQRYEESGIAVRLFDIIEDNIRTIRDSSGKKGLLLEKAGIPGDLSDINNTIYQEIKGYNRQIDNMKDRLASKENDYYKKFARLERILSDMMAQGNYFISQMNSK